MKTAAIYARVSSTRQREEQTIASQMAALRTYAEEAGIDVPAEWVFEDDGYSGASLVRPALERLRDLVAEVDIPMVLCFAPDRLARKYAYQVVLVEELARAGTEMHFVKGPRGDSAEDELLLQFQGMIAEYERAQIVERTRRGKLHRARAGATAVLCGAPYGYHYRCKSDEADAVYEIVEEEAQVVREMFRRYVEDAASIAGLTRWLAEQGIVTATGKSKWDRSTIWAMLRNPAYCGRAAFGKTTRTDERARPNRRTRLRDAKLVSRPPTRERPREEWIEIPVPAILSEETFEMAARRLADNKRFASRRTREPSLLQGLIVCERCGYAYYRTATKTSARKLYYYRCLGSDAYRYENGRVCDSKPVRQDHLDDLVWDHVTKLLANPDLIRAELDRRLQEMQSADPVTAQKSQLEMQLRRTERRIQRLVDAYQEELVPLDELRNRAPTLRSRASALHSQLESIEARETDRARCLKLAESLEGFLSRLNQTAKEISTEQRQQVVRVLVKEVLVGPERVLIRHSIPTSEPDPTPGYLLRGRSPKASPRRPSR